MPIRRAIGDSVRLTGGEELTPKVTVIESTYYRRQVGDKLLLIDAPEGISVATLQAMIVWAEEESDDS